jgi:hypothetical protein
MLLVTRFEATNLITEPGPYVDWGSSIFAFVPRFSVNYRKSRAA